MPCRHVTGQDVWCGCHWHATHSALHSPSGIPGTQVRTDRDAGRPHCCRLAPVRQDALHHLGYVLPLLMQPSLLFFPIVAGHAVPYFDYLQVLTTQMSSQVLQQVCFFTLCLSVFHAPTCSKCHNAYFSLAPITFLAVFQVKHKCCCVNQLGRPEACKGFAAQ